MADSHRTYLPVRDTQKAHVYFGTAKWNGFCVSVHVKSLYNQKAPLDAMDKMDIDKIAEIHRQIDVVLLRDWDPIGVAHEPHAQDEYRSYVRGVYDVAVQTRSAQAVAEHLVKIEREYMGIRGFRRWRKRLPVAMKILNLVSEVGPIP